MRLIVTVVLIMLLSIARGQTIEVKTDEFTKAKTAITSWENLKSDVGGEWSFRFRKINTSLFFDLKLNGRSVSIGDNDLFYFKLDNDSIVTIKSTGISERCLGCGATGFVGSNAMGTKASFLLSEDGFLALNSRPVVKVRIQTNSGYMDEDVRGKGVQKLSNAVSLISKVK